MDKSEPEKDFEEYRKYLHAEALKLASFISVYRQIEEPKDTHLNAMRWAPAFFQTTQEALWTAIINWTHKLFDSKSQRGFVNFLSFVAKNISLFSLSELKRRKGFSEEDIVGKKPITQAEIREDKKRLANIASLQSIRIRRNKFHAHFDEDYFFQRGKLQEEAPLKMSDLKEIEVTMDHVLNRYSRAYDANDFVLEPGNIKDLKNLLDRVE